jgi:hypothetical protein
MKRTRWLRAIVLIGLMASGGGAFSAEPGTGQWLLETCRGDKGDVGKSFCLGYAMGLADLMVGQQRICLPPDLTSEQIRLVVEGYLRDNPGKLQHHPVLLVIEALDTNFPCR